MNLKLFGYNSELKEYGIRGLLAKYKDFLKKLTFTLDKII